MPVSDAPDKATRPAVPLEALPRVDVLGISVIAGDRERTLGAIAARIAERRGGYVCFANAHLVEESRRTPRLAEAMNSSCATVPDGAPVALLARLRSGAKTPRVTGSDAFDYICSKSVNGEYSHFFLGGRPDTLARLKTSVEAAYPGLVVAGAYAPAFTRDLAPQAEELARVVLSSGADVVWVGVGAPKQELLMRHLSSHLPASVALGVGAVFDFITGEKPRAPRVLRRCGLEWAFRLLCEPSRLWRRYLVLGSSFVWHAAGAVAIRSLGARTPTQRDIDLG